VINEDREEIERTSYAVCRDFMGGGVEWHSFDCWALKSFARQVMFG
jgi:hypothetical protein